MFVHLSPWAFLGFTFVSECLVCLKFSVSLSVSILVSLSVSVSVISGLQDFGSQFLCCCLKGLCFSSLYLCLLGLLALPGWALPFWPEGPLGLGGFLAAPPAHREARLG